MDVSLMAEQTITYHFDQSKLELKNIISFSLYVIDIAEKNKIVQKQESLVSHRRVLFQKPRSMFAQTALETLHGSTEDESTNLCVYLAALFRE